MKVRIEGVRFSYGSHEVLRGVDLDELAAGEVTALVGPNATGKSTLFKCLAGLLSPEGSIFLDGEASSPGRGRDRTAVITYLPQEFLANTALTVFEVVLIANHQSGRWRVSKTDAAAVSHVLARLGIAHLAGRYLGELSGGQHQLVSVAQALARRPQVLLLDEPINSLDLHHQLRLLGLIGQIARDDDITVVMAIHDLNLAARFAQRMVVLHEGRVVASGAPVDVLTAEMLRTVYEVTAKVTRDEQGLPLVVPLGALDHAEPVHPTTSPKASIPLRSYGATNDHHTNYKGSKTQ